MHQLWGGREQDKKNATSITTATARPWFKREEAARIDCDLSSEHDASFTYHLTSSVTISPMLVNIEPGTRNRTPKQNPKLRTPSPIDTESSMALHESVYRQSERSPRGTPFRTEPGASSNLELESLELSPRHASDL